MTERIKLLLAIAFLEEITLATGKYSDLNGSPIVADAYQILGMIGEDNE